ncbi:MAG: nucleoside hydrolase [Armatimonadota bacterium]|nr:nucleoside hydrolase [Armatimonadota bacterium]
MRFLVIDTDTGIDDAIAILMALRDPSCRVVAITAVAGNVPLPRVLANIGIVLDAAGAGPIPVYPGAARPLLGEPVHATYVHGEDGLGDAGFPTSSRPVEGEPAALALIRLARQQPRALTLVTLGPLTNLALALALEPTLAELLARIVVMGGAVHGRGNVTPAAEFNIYADPEAAVVVFDRVPELTLVPWETVLDHRVPWDRWDRLTNAGPLGQHFVRPMTSRLVDWIRTARGLDGFPLADPLAMAVALHEACVQKVRQATVAVETGGRLTRGATPVADGMPHSRGKARIVEAVDAGQFEQMLQRACTGAYHLTPSGR